MADGTYGGQQRGCSMPERRGFREIQNNYDTQGAVDIRNEGEGSSGR